MTPENYEFYVSARVRMHMQTWADEWVKQKVLEYRLTQAEEGPGFCYIPGLPITFDSYLWQKFGEETQYVSLAYL